MADLVEDIKGRLSIEDTVSQYVQLKKAGRNLKGLCPFHSEKTSSFIVSPEKQICHCFGCNKGGDIFTFIQEIEGITFVESLELLADRAGLKADLSKYRKKASKSEKDDYYKAHELATEFFEKQLYKTSDGKKVLEYLHKRGLKDEAIKEFKIGFAPDKYDALYPFLLKKVISKEVLIKAGLVSAKKLTSDQVYDKYRSRLMFPIFNYLGRICGFGGRALKKDQVPKYLNSPENIIYNKSKVLYGLSFAKQAVKEEDKAILVEGYFDVILPYQEGIKNVAASSGIAISKDQARTIKRLTSNVVTCFDSDEAGFEATKRAYFILQDQDLSVKTISLEEKDPADFVLKNGEKFKELVDDAPNFVTFFMEKLLSQNDVSALDGRRSVIKELLPCYKQMSASTRDYFVRELSQALSIKEKYLYEEMENYKLPVDHPVRIVQESKSRLGMQELILAINLEYPFLFKLTKEFLENEDFEDYLKDIYKELGDQYNSARENFEAWLYDKGVLARERAKVDVLRLYAEEQYNGFGEESLELELEKLIDKLKRDRRIEKLKGIQSQIIEAEKSEDKELLKKLLEEQQGLLKN